MRDIEPPFTVVYEGFTLRIVEHVLGDRRVFDVHYPNGVKPFMVTVALNKDGRKFWTSVPQGKQYDAEQIGKLIANYIRSK